ncbi:MAG: hypothetical protein DME26_20505, partial [Verrucomicrobia bacterium]
EIAQAAALNSAQPALNSFDTVVPAPGLTLTLSRSYRFSIDQRYAMGPFGRGWSTFWSTSLRVQPDGAVEVVGPSRTIRRFEPDSRSNSYFALASDGGTLSRVAGGDFELQEADGLIVRFLTDGKLDYIQDSNGNRVMANYSSGRLSTLVHSAGQSLAIAYNAAGLIQAVIDSSGRTNTYTYDAANQHLTFFRNHRGQTIEYAYSSGAGLAIEHALMSMNYAGGSHDYFGYDSAGRLASVYRDGNTERTEFSYDTAGMITITDATGAQNRMFFDHTGATVRRDQRTIGSVLYTFDDLHRVTGVTDASGRLASYTYTGSDRITGGTDPNGQSSHYTYSATLTRMTSVTDVRTNTTLYTYDSRGNLTAVIPPDQRQKSYGYDAQGNLLSVTNRRGEVIRFAYNTAGRVTRETLPNGQFTDFGFDGRGNLIGVTNTSGLTTFEHDSADRMTKVTYPNGRFLVFNYDQENRRTQMRDPEGFAVNYGYDSLGRLTTLSNNPGGLLVRYAYDPAGRPMREDRGNGSYTTYQYECCNLVSHLVNYSSNGVINSRFDYSHDALGRISTLAMVDGQWTYQYDPNDQLIRAVFASTNPVISNQDFSYMYDAAGNRVRSIENGVTLDYSVNALNQYAAVGGLAYSYDAEGNLLHEASGQRVVNYTYDFNNRLTRVVAPDGTWEYEYDALGNPTAMVHNAQRTEFLVDPVGLGKALTEYSNAGSAEARYIDGLGLVCRLDRSGNAFYYDFDAVGNTAGITDVSGNYVNRYAYAPFGAK